jgi:hypothetical protein
MNISEDLHSPCNWDWKGQGTKQITQDKHHNQHETACAITKCYAEWTALLLCIQKALGSKPSLLTKVYFYESLEINAKTT